MKGNALTHLAKYFLGIDSVVTQTSITEQKALVKYIEKANIIVEIGVFEGYNTREFGKHSPSDANIYAIDPFFKGSFGINYGKIMAKKEWARTGVSKKIKIIEGFSWDVIDKIPNNIDLLFIDGDHSFDGVKKDFDLYANKMSKNGVIALHDARVFENGWTRPDWGPVMLVEQHIRNQHSWKIIEEVDSLVLVTRNS